MITFSKLGKKGHLGNQLFQIASTIGLAKKHNHDFAFKQWKYKDYFKNQLLEINDCSLTNLPEKHYEYHDWDIKKDNYDIEGWLQTEKYFDKELTKYYFAFKENLLNNVKNKYEEAFKKQTILLSIRRGDFVNHPDYFQVPIKFYLGALIKHFANWEDYNLIVLSDDVEYCKFHFDCLPNTYFGGGLNAVEQLCLGSLCNHFIIGNSTFSWWSAWLGEKENSKVITPIKNFRGEKAKELNDKDYFPARWTKFDFENFKAELNAKIYIKNNGFLSSITADYVSYFFKVKAFNYLDDYKDLPLKSIDETTIYSDSVICSPIAIYYLYLQAFKFKKNSELNFYKKVKINYKLSHWFFDNYKDFGIYSSMFNFEINKSSNSIALMSYNGEKTSTENRILTFCVGQFSKYSGYSFYLEQNRRKTIIFIKKLIKKTLKIK